MENLLSRRFGNKPREDTFRDVGEKVKAKHRRAQQKKRAGNELREAMEEYNKNKRISRAERRKRFARKHNRRGWRRK